MHKESDHVIQCKFKSHYNQKPSLKTIKKILIFKTAQDNDNSVEQYKYEGDIYSPIYAT